MSNWITPAAVFGTIALIAAMVGVAACHTDTMPDPDEFQSFEIFPDGHELTLRGDVEGIYETGDFRMDPAFGISEEEILVLNPRIGSEQIEENDEVIVKGTVRELTFAEVDSEFGNDWSLFEADFETPKVLVAERVEVADEAWF